MKIVLQNEIIDFLNEQVDCYNTSQFIESDPISIPHLFSWKPDIEISAFLTATISWGQRLTLIRNARNLMKLMDDSPYEFVLQHNTADLKRFESFVHRTFNGKNAVFFIQRLKHIYNKFKTLEDAFAPHLPDVKSRILFFREEFLGANPEFIHSRHISNPFDNSAAKRLNMFLRWMVRNDERKVDFGIWEKMKSADLMIPLDVHSGTVSRQLGILNRKQNDWKAVEELTEMLRKFDPIDPIKYDYALFGLGVNGDLKSKKPALHY